MSKTLIYIYIIIFFISCGGNSEEIPPVTETPKEEIPKEEEKEETPTEETDFSKIEVPANPGDGMKWEFQADISDAFDYEYPGESKLTEFGENKWTNFYHNTWEGPGPTIWKHENTSVSGGNLRLKTTREPGEMKTYDTGNGDKTDKATRLGCITSTKRVKYPVFVEARVKVANAFFASDIWMLSPDDTQEIDILEAYGAQNPRNEQSWFSERLHISHHVFIRTPFQDYQPKDSSTWYKDPTGEYPFWSNDWIRIGVYWKSPTYLEYYLNGTLIKVMDNLDTVGGKDGIDPLNYTSPTGNPADRTGLNKEMDIIINAEVQNWNADKGRMPTDEEISNSPEEHTLKVDWIRIFKPVQE
ncbi:LamG domain-containing protein [Flavivirga algicola]|uniref:Beta-agarase n=1 Tax=Flavivirga algicola TaxID=2729136 RepID=A0ABX1S2A6_9FLAO|nr:beta-agarase [Flavivirga algicola]NMH88854.1 beta-agarase [Flavivirga algicola]